VRRLHGAEDDDDGHADAHYQHGAHREDHNVVKQVDDDEVAGGA
jgi:hypothetical protein